LEDCAGKSDGNQMTKSINYILLTLLALTSFCHGQCAPDPCTQGQVCSSTSFTPIWGPKPIPTTLTIAEATEPATLWLPAFVLGSTGFCHSFHAAGGTPPYKWLLGKDSSFSNVWIDSIGSLHGLPKSAGNFDLAVRVTDSLGATQRVVFHIQVCTSTQYCSGFGN